MMTWMLRSWPAMLVLAFMTWRTFSQATAVDWLEYACLSASCLGSLLNIIVVALNGGMPARLAPDEIPDDARPFYHAIDHKSRCPWLADWIPIGSWLISPGDVLLAIGVVGMIGREILS